MIKNKYLDFILKSLVVILGSFLVSFANLAFLEPSGINAGGLNGIAIIITSFIENAKTAKDVYNICISSFTVILWLIGLIFIGKDFALKTLIASIAFPLSTALLTYVPFLNTFVTHIKEATITAGNPMVGELLLTGIFGGIIVGAGVAITFVGGGSTGGVDVFPCMMEKYLHIKNSIANFIVDGTIILIGIFVLCPRDSSGADKMLVKCLCGILSSCITSVLIEFIYVGNQTSYQVDIISSKWEEISRYAQDVLDRGTTIIRAEGGYKQEERVILRIVFDKKQYQKLRQEISKIDPNAFITFTQTNAVYGEGFRSNKNEKPKLFKKKNNKKDGK